MTDSLPTPSLKGRPVATSHGAIEAAAFRLFAEHGFESTTLEDIAREVGVGRRTLFRYFGSKNDIAWGQFEATLVDFRRGLRDLSDDLPVHEAVRLAVRSFNTLPDGAQAQHRERMRLILDTPALQAHSVLRYAEWRGVIVDFVAERHGLDPGDLLPRTVGHVSLALALAAYEVWLEDEDSVLVDLLDEALSELRRHLGVG